MVRLILPILFLAISCQNMKHDISGDPNIVIQEITQYCSEQLYKSEINRARVNYFPKSRLILTSFWKKHKFDENGEFFFHVYPKQINNLPLNRRQHKFFNKPKISQGFIKSEEPYFYSWQRIYPQIPIKRIELGQFINGKKTWKVVYESHHITDTIEIKDKKEDLNTLIPLIKLNKTDLRLLLDTQNNDLILKGDLTEESICDSLYLQIKNVSDILTGHSKKIDGKKLLNNAFNFSIPLPKGANEIQLNSFKGKEEVESKMINLFHVLYAQGSPNLNKGEFIRYLIETNLEQLTSSKETDLSVFKLPKSKKLYVIGSKNLDFFDFSVLDDLGIGYTHKSKLDSLIIDEKDDYLRLYRIEL
jgi:hypothetical protein